MPTGVSGVPLVQFASAVTFGRGFRYFGEGWLAVRYGEAAVELLVPVAVDWGVGTSWYEAKG